MTGPRAGFDGRTARSVRSRGSILEATIDLIESGNRQPTVPQVAQRAGVSVRLVFHHFREVRVLYRSAAELRTARTRSLIGIVPPRGPVAVRTAAICRQRREVYEAIAPVLRATMARTRDHDDGTGELHALLRHQLMVGLRPEILSRGGHGPLLLESLDLAIGWQRWSSLRVDGRSATQAEQVMVRTVTALVG